MRQSPIVLNDRALLLGLKVPNEKMRELNLKFRCDRRH